VFSLLSKTYQIYSKIEDYFFSPSFVNKIFFVFLLFLAGLIRYASLDFQSGDYGSFLSPWYDFIMDNGKWKALGQNFANYTPPYLYLLVLATYLPIPKIAAIKIISIFFDFLLALTVFSIVKLIVEIKQKNAQKILNNPNISKNKSENNSNSHNSNFSIPKKSLNQNSDNQNSYNSDNIQSILKENLENNLNNSFDLQTDNFTQNSAQNLQNNTIDSSKTFSKIFQTKNLKIQFENSKPILPKFNLPIIAFFVVLFSPTVVFNGAVWAQCDVIYTTFFVLSFLQILKSRYLASFIWLGIGISFKMQTAFLMPIFVLLFLLRKVNFLYFLILPIIYILAILPSYFIGRPFVELLRIYLDQSGSYNNLTNNAPTFYHWLGGGNYDVLSKIGFVIAVLNCTIICYIFWLRSQKIFRKDRNYNQNFQINPPLNLILNSDSQSSDFQNLLKKTENSDQKNQKLNSDLTSNHSVILRDSNQNILENGEEKTENLQKVKNHENLENGTFENSNLEISQNAKISENKTNPKQISNKKLKFSLWQKIKKRQNINSKNTANKAEISEEIASFWFDLALLTSVSVPYFLPKMHERYFFVADIVSILYTFWRPSHFWVAIIVNLVSFFAYGPFLLGTKAFDFSLLSLALFGLITYLFIYNIRKILEN